MIEPIKIKSVREVLECTHLRIPVYQRPYTWNIKNVRQLWKDFITFNGQNKYRLGTLVLHQDKDKESCEIIYNIVDGQQRLLTLMLTAQVLEEKEVNGFKLNKQRFSPFFPYPVPKQTLYNLQNNFQYLDDLIVETEIDTDLLSFIFDRCEFVVVILSDISEAFQFFDAQNARGKSLNPHDLLKAFHLRKFNANEIKNDALQEFALQKTMKETVKYWEDSEESELADFFNEYLYHIRCWMYGKDVTYFSDKDLSLFKGVDLDSSNLPLKHLSLTLVEGSKKKDNKIYFPHKLDQVIINGRYFFEWVKHYQQWQIHKENSLTSKFSLKNELVESEHGILNLLNSYDGCYRVGDSYVRNLFYCLLMAYIDRFGYQQLSKAIKVAFIWAYTIRLESQRVSLSSINNHVRSNNLFMILRNAASSNEFLEIELKKISPKTEIELVKGLIGNNSVYSWFVTLGYIDEGK